MSKLIHPDVTLVPLLQRIANASLHYHLYTNNLVPDLSKVLADFTELTGGTGYAVITVAVGDFTILSVSAHKGTIIAPPITFSMTATPATSVYGYFITDTGNTILLGACRFDDAPIDLSAGADIPLLPILGDESLFSS